jgi:hypothetical protein
MTTLHIRIPKWLDFICIWPVLIYRRLKYGYTFRKIYLGGGLWTILDQKDYYRLRDINWWVHGNGSSLYAVCSIVTAPGKTVIKRMHREIMNPPPGLLVDHRHGNTLDNRRSELRLATRSQNQYNKRKTRSNTTSKYKGVSYDKANQKWAAKILYKGKEKWLDRFGNEIEAAIAYDKAAKKYFGEFARLNFPEN